MTANIEIKVRCADLGRARKIAEEKATAHLGVDRQVDTYFHTAGGRLKLRESSLSGTQLVPYLRDDAPEVRRSDYAVVAVEDGARMKQLLTAILGERGVVVKEREIFLVDNVRIHLDRVEGLGEFVELEAVFEGRVEQEETERSKVNALMAALGLRAQDIVDVSYENLMLEVRP